MRAAGGWRGWGFIGAERGESLAVDIRDGVYTANRWAALAEFAGWMREQGARLDAGTAVILDIDKTALGARGRNDGAIDRARVAAIEATVAEALGLKFDQEAFRRAYAAINVPKYHPFTTDNQDYVAYICLMVSAGFCAIDELLAEVDAGALKSFNEFIAQVDAQRDNLAGEGLRALHRRHLRPRAGGGCDAVQGFPPPRVRGDGRPHGLSAGRRAARPAADGRDLPHARGVDFAAWLRDRGCLLMAVSDKPDEASLPTPELVARGYLPLHRTPTHVIGQAIAGLLPE